MLIENKQEIQHDIKDYYITLLSGETISLSQIIQEDIDEDSEGFISIDLKTFGYNQRLYDAFKNKELIQCIVKHSTNVDIKTNENINRTFVYDKYFKIHTFVSCWNRDCIDYSITFQTV